MKKKKKQIFVRASKSLATCRHLPHTATEGITRTRNGQHLTRTRAHNNTINEHLHGINLTCIMGGGDTDNNKLHTHIIRLTHRYMLCGSHRENFQLERYINMGLYGHTHRAAHVSDIPPRSAAGLNGGAARAARLRAPSLPLPLPSPADAEPDLLLPCLRRSASFRAASN